MPVELFRAENFRCFERVEIAPSPDYNLIYGANASGKTSLLEALAYLGRAKSFRGAPTTSLLRHATDEFVLFGRVVSGDRVHQLGVRNSRKGLEVRVDGESNGGSAALAEALPLQVIDPDVHELVAGGPENRRRYLDWVAFHVEPAFLPVWRRFRRALKQRNASLKAGGAGIDAWTAELATSGEEIHRIRQVALELCLDGLSEHGQSLLGGEVGFEYRSGWGADLALGEALEENLERDLQQGSTQVGPHRADLKLRYDDRQARRLVSRGQQKLLACSMVLAATELVQTHRKQPMLVLLDDPAAELDGNSLSLLMGQVFSLGAQVIATTLDRDALSFPAPPAVFHVEHGVLRPD